MSSEWWIRQKICCAAILICLSGCVFKKPLDLAAEVEKEKKLRFLLNQAAIQIQTDQERGLDKAEASLNLAKWLNPTDARVVDGFGIIAFHRKNYDEALRLFKKANEYDRENDAIYVHLALVAEKNGDILAAYQLLDTSIEKNPMNYEAHNNLAALLTNNKIPGVNCKQRAQEELDKARLIIGIETPISKHNQKILDNIKE